MLPIGREMMRKSKVVNKIYFLLEKDMFVDLMTR